MNITLDQVLSFCLTATPDQKASITNTMNPVQTRQQKAANTLATLRKGNVVTFLYDKVDYTAEVESINRTTATVKITKIIGSPRRSLSVGSIVKVGASLLKT